MTPPRPIPSAVYERDLFLRKLGELGLDTEFARQVLDALGEKFTFDNLRTAVDLLKIGHSDPEAPVIGEKMVLLARSNYEVAFRRTDRSPNASSFHFHRVRAMGSRTRGSFAFAKTIHLPSTMRPTPHMMAGRFSRSCWRREIFFTSRSVR